MRVGIVGGTFNPIHFGHIYPVEEAAEKLKLEKVIFIPAYSPPHKPDDIIASARHRVNMINLALKEYPLFELSTLEIDRKGVSYSIDTIAALMEKRKEDDFFFIMGIDAFSEIDSWKDSTVLLKSSNFAVIAREGEIFSDLMEKMIKYLKEKIGDLQFDFNAVESKSNLKCAKIKFLPYSIVPIETKQVNISSTEIRNKIKNRETIENLVAHDVNIYIEKNRIYR